MSMTIFILSTSVILQLAAVVLAIRLIRVSERFVAWLVIAAAFFVQFVRRGYTLYSFLSGGLAHPPDLVSESFGLFISLLMVIGIAAIAPIIRALQTIIAERKRAETEIHRLNRDLMALSQVNQALLHETDEEKLIRQICQIIIDTAGYRLVWVGFKQDDEAKSIKPVASQGFEAGYLENLKLTWADTETGRGPTGTAIRTGKPSICQNILTDPKFLPWREEALKRGYASSIALPLISGGKAFGALNIYSAEADAFGGKEVELLIEMANDLAFGIETLRGREEMVSVKELGRLKSLFIASMSHELRTPLNSIIGFTGILLMGMAGELNEEQRKQLTMVKSSAGHLLTLINEVIDVSKIEAEKIQLTIEEFDLSRVVCEVKDSFAVAVEEKALKLSAEMPDKAAVKSDERRIKQIIMNLVSNAIKFTEKGEIGIRVTGNGNSVAISVKDTGIGIKEEDMPKLFKQFSRIMVEGQPLQEGTGLGLYLSQKLARVLGGEIKAKSEFGKGSEFTLTLPLEYKEG
jgi:signal transduction histidine kinase